MKPNQADEINKTDNKAISDELSEKSPTLAESPNPEITEVEEGAVKNELPGQNENEHIDEEVQNADKATNEADGNNSELVDEATPGEVASEQPSTNIEDGPINVEAEPEASVKSETVDQDATTVHKKTKLGFSAILVPALVIMALLVTYMAVFASKAQPGVSLAGMSVSGKSQTELEAIAKAQSEKIQITFKTAKKTETTKPSTAGISFDLKATAKNALASKTDFVDRLMPWKKVNVPLVYSVNHTALDAYLEKNVAVGWYLPKNASIVFNPTTKTYDVVNSEPGEGVQFWQVKKAINEVALSPGDVVANIKPVPVKASIDNSVAKKAQEQANTLLKSDIKMLQNGTRVFYLEPQEIDTLIDIVPSAQSGKIEVSVNEDRVQKFVDTDITNTIAKASRERVVIENPETGQKTVLQEGTPGQKLAKNKQLAKEITEALRSGKPYSKEISVEGSGEIAEKKFVGKNRWAEVDLTKQMAYMRLDDQVIMSFRISSGRAVTPTDPGEWNVYGKLPLRTMRGTINGESYEVPNVPWVVYFHDGEAFHGTYWHNNFGTPMSHGCINMTIPDAKMMYNFAYVGMRVSVHY